MTDTLISIGNGLVNGGRAVVFIFSLCLLFAFAAVKMGQWLKRRREEDTTPVENHYNVGDLDGTQWPSIAGGMHPDDTPDPPLDTSGMSLQDRLNLIEDSRLGTDLGGAMKPRGTFDGLGKFRGYENDVPIFDDPEKKS